MRVPFATDYGTGQPEMLNFPEKYREGFEWRDVEPFAAKMRVIEYSRGRTSARFIMIDEATQITYPVFLTDMLYIIKMSDLHRGETANVWEACKRGANYGIRIANSEH